MGRNRGDLPALPMGEQPVVERVLAGPVVADTFAGRIHVEWDNSATVTPLGQLPFFIEYLKQGNCPSGVTVALLSHSTWMRPAKVSATTGPADIRSITGCSSAGSGGKSPRFLPIPHDISDLPNRRRLPTLAHPGARPTLDGTHLLRRGDPRESGHWSAEPGEPDLRPQDQPLHPRAVPYPRHYGWRRSLVAYRLQEVPYQTIPQAAGGASNRHPHQRHPRLWYRPPHRESC